MRLGKREYRHDVRTLRLSPLLATDIKVPETFDFDKKRSKFPVSSWGNDQWGDCVMAGRANQTLRIERVEHRRTPVLSPADVIQAYQEEVFRQFGYRTVLPGDANDDGLYVLEAIKGWRNIGWPIKMSAKKEPHLQKIAAYGEIDKLNRNAVRAAVYFLHGIHMGLALPQTAAVQMRNGKPWDVEAGNAPGTQPDSWGGHLVYAKRYDKNGVYCMTWGREVYMTNAFIERYCDEIWAVVDDIDSKSKYLNVQGMLDHLRQIGASNIA